eukprot:gene6812-9328_t
MSVTTAENETNDSNKNELPKLLYVGEYAKKLKWLRRISFTSSFLIVAFMPVAATVNFGVVPIVAQLAIATTGLVTSLFSTMLLHGVSTPYVTSLKEIPPINPVTSERTFIVTRLSIVGRFIDNTFELSQAEKSTVHPFGSFRIKGTNKYFYVFGGTLTDPFVRQTFAK